MTTRNETSHPLLPLNSSEIRAASGLVTAAWPLKTALRFKTIVLQEPPKAQMIHYLECEHRNKPLPAIDRKAFVSYYAKTPTDLLFEAVANLTTGQLTDHIQLGKFHGHLDPEEATAAEAAVLNNAQFKQAIETLQLPKGTVVCADAWPYGPEPEHEGDNSRKFQVYVYMRDPENPSEADSNYYAFPLPISPVLDAHTMEVLRIDILPTGRDVSVASPVPPYKPVPANEYMPKYNPPRAGLKPLQVVQPEGASFELTTLGEVGWLMNWQKWSFRIGYNQREGTVLYDVRYDSRPLFYRVSLSDLTIPYGDPRSPYNTKSSFDLGDAGAGALANNLQLGCDCLGFIQYLTAVISDTNGQPTALENCVCIHEQDNGIGWKHTNFRTNTAAITRARELVLQSIITVANYEYILAFMFSQAGDLTYEVRATGILSTQPIDQDVFDCPYGTVVHPGVLAAHHQHIFSLRVVPMLDGFYNNRVVYEEAFPMPLDATTNPRGVGYYSQQTVVTESGGYDLNSGTNRVFQIQNTGSLNPVNKQPVAYKIHTPPFQPMLASPSSFHHKRAEFADHNIYVTSHKDRELFSGGWYTYQSEGGDGVRSWANRKDNVAGADADPVVWIQFGINHIARIEDFPVMPCEVVKVTMRPVNFFTKNPALDVPPSTQLFNKSTLAPVPRSALVERESNAGPCCSKI